MTFFFVVEQVDVQSAMQELAHWEIEINQLARQLLLQRAAGLETIKQAS